MSGTRLNEGERSSAGRIGDPGGADLQALLHQVARSHGYAGAVYLHLGHVSPAFESPRQVEPRRLVATPRFDASQYLQRNYFAEDQIAHRAARSYSPFVWRLSDLVEPSAGRCAVHHAMARWGMDEGVAAPIQDHALGPALLNLYGASGERCAPSDGLVEAAVKVHETAIRSDAGVSSGNDAQLSRREMEVLRLAALGRTEQETAMGLGLSRRGVQFHLARAMERLGTSNKTAAVARAVSAGLIKL